MRQLKVIGVLPVLFFLGCNPAADSGSTPEPDAVATPAATPGQGTYTAAQKVTLSCDTERAAIYYTTNGSTPATSSILYASPVNINKTTTLKAIAVKSGMDDSGVMTAVYTITIDDEDEVPTEKVATPAAKPGQGNYTAAQKVTLSCDTEGAAIYYTIDDSTPATSSTRYASPVNINKTTTLKAIAVKSGMDDSDVMTAVYTINTGTPGDDVILHTKWPFMVGAAAPTGAFTTTDKQYPLLKHFNVLVAENDMKPQSIMPYSKPATFPGTYNWTNADKLVNYAKANNTKVRGHVLVWHSQTPDYLFDVTGSGNTATTTMTKAVLYDRMEKHIKTVFEKYKGDVGWWDVCNEVVGDNGQIRAAGNPSSGGSWYTKVMENSGLTGMDRYEFVLKAFQWARQYADANGGTNVQLYLTDYNIEYSGAKQTEFGNLLDYLITNNAPIDGVGLQTHIKWDWPSVTEIANAIDKFAAKTRKDGTKLMTQVTELDMSIFSNSESSVTTLSDAVRDTRLKTQAAKYRQLFDIFRQKYDAGKLDMVLVWGVADGHSWLNNRPSGRTDYPLLFDRNYQPKEAYRKLVE